jgi:hypothetical protein
MTEIKFIMFQTHHDGDSAIEHFIDSAVFWDADSHELRFSSIEKRPPIPYPETEYQRIEAECYAMETIAKVKTVIEHENAKTIKDARSRIETWDELSTKEKIRVLAEEKLMFVYSMQATVGKVVIGARFDL